jgi:hypothetical protein
VAVHLILLCSGTSVQSFTACASRAQSCDIHGFSNSSAELTFWQGSTDDLLKISERRAKSRACNGRWADGRIGVTFNAQMEVREETQYGEVLAQPNPHGTRCGNSKDIPPRVNCAQFREVMNDIAGKGLSNARGACGDVRLAPRNVICKDEGEMSHVPH